MRQFAVAVGLLTHTIRRLNFAISTDNESARRKYI